MSAPRVSPMPRALRVAFVTSARRAWDDRGGAAVMVAFYVFVVAVVGSLWRAAADARGGTLAGYTGAALFWYIAASEAATVSINIRLIEDVGNDIAGGAIVAEMLRPMSIIALRIASEIGRVVPRLCACIGAGSVLSIVVVGAPIKFAAALLALPALLLAVICNVAAQYAFASVAFWIRDARSTWFLYQKFVFIVGGMLLPFEILPHAMRTVAWALPFSAMAYIPARIASGHVQPVLLLIQLAWLVAMLSLAGVVFRAGERRLEVVGG